MPVCPDGHESSTEDWCSFCGTQMTASAAAPSTAAGAGVGPAPSSHPTGPYGTGGPLPGPGPATFGESTQIAERCVNCASQLPSGAQFCEECGHNQALPPAEAQLPQQSPQQPAFGSTVGVVPGPAVAPVGESTFPSSASSGSVTGGRQRGSDEEWPLTPPATPATGTWMAVVTADRDYFQQMMARSGPDAQGLFFPPYCPERRIPLRGPQMRIGRRSAKTGSIPEIDLASSPEDPGVSHVHAMLEEQPDGTWTVTDKNATNGTTLNGSPDPVVPDQPIALKDGDRIHVGAWTTITLRQL